MQRLLRVVIGVSMFALTCSTSLQAAASASLEGILRSAETMVCDASPVYTAVAAPAPVIFCGTPTPQGVTSKTCKAEAVLPCPAGQTPANVNCSVGADCDPPAHGKFCTCKYECHAN